MGIEIEIYRKMVLVLTYQLKHYKYVNSSIFQLLAYSSRNDRGENFKASEWKHHHIVD